MDGTDLRPTTRPPHQAPLSHVPGWWTPAYDRRAYHPHKQEKTTRADREGGINLGDDRQPPAAGHLITAGGAMSLKVGAESNEGGGRRGSGAKETYSMWRRVGRARCAEAAVDPRRATTAGRDDGHTWIVKQVARVPKRT